MPPTLFFLEVHVPSLGGDPFPIERGRAYLLSIPAVKTVQLP